ncbi:hypothetical protein IWQ61_001297 [Dispira simplex]|nr:hypothetical protein IWQ61_001297 [Dispira simplex]
MGKEGNWQKVTLQDMIKKKPAKLSAKARKRKEIVKEKALANEDKLQKKRLESATRFERTTTRKTLWE